MDPPRKQFCYSDRHMRRKAKQEFESSMQEINSTYLASKSSPSINAPKRSLETNDDLQRASSSNCNEDDADETIQLHNECEETINIDDYSNWYEVETNINVSNVKEDLKNSDDDIWLDSILDQPEEIREADIFEEVEFDFRYSDSDESYIDELEFDDYICNDKDASYRAKETPNEIISAENINNGSESHFVREYLATDISDSLKSVLSQWAVKCMIPHLSITKLLHSIRKNTPVLSLPLDSRTLLKTPRHSDISNIQGGLYCHFKLEKAIEKIIEKRTSLNIHHKIINLVINIDGAPLGKSSEKNLWPILCSEKDIKDVYIVGVYCGQSKPKDVNEFLKPFVDEATTFINNGFIFKEEKYKVNVYAFILDAPAKAFVLNVKYHSGYDSCTKCDIVGTRYRCVCFPGKVGVLRTDENFRLYNYNEYQKDETILNTIPNLGLVTSVPLDPMHLVYLGCTRKLLLIWLGSSLIYKLPQIKQDIISKKLLLLRSYMTYDFNRRPRELKFIKFFKATEFRQFLLYTGVIVLKNNVHPDVYLNFLTLHISISILSNPKFCSEKSYIDYVEKMLVKFVEDFEKIYGPHYVSYNFHNLLHLVTDARKYGELDKFSAFRFENFIATIKRLIRKGHQPLQQLLLRCAEIEIMKEKLLNENNEQRLQLYHQHNEGPLTNEFQNVSEYKVLDFDAFKINCRDNINNYVQISNSFIVKAYNFIKNTNGEIYVIGKQIPVIGSLYEFPLSSSEIGINVIQNLENNNFKSWNVNQITAKLLKLPYENNFVTFPLLHTQKVNK